jgi:trehalose/maltose transport system substrate-binding protein
MARTVQDAERAAGSPDFWGFVWQGAAYEGLTCNALEWQVSAGAGAIIGSGGGIEVNDARTIAAMERASSWVGTISPPGVTTYAEEDARAIWQTGNACFMRNWPYAYPLGNAADPTTGERPVIAGRFDVCPLPAGEGASAAALGGWQLMVSRYSKHPELAARLARFLTNAEEQKLRAIRGAFNPTRPALYDDAEVLAATPFFDTLRDVWSGAVARPSTISGRRYNQVSTAYFTAVHDILTGAPAAARLAELEQELRRILR